MTSRFVLALLSSFLLVCLVVTACNPVSNQAPLLDGGDGLSGDDAGSHVDAGTPVDAGTHDAGMPDAGLPDAGLLEDGGVLVFCAALEDAGLPDLGGDCETCVAGNCCAQIGNCANNDVPNDGGFSPCALLVKCALACVADGGTESKCGFACAFKYPKGVDDAQDAISCVQSSCTSSCPGL